jgi:hypothetical protein
MLMDTAPPAAFTLLMASKRDTEVENFAGSSRLHSSDPPKHMDQKRSDLLFLL